MVHRRWPARRRSGHAEHRRLLVLRSARRGDEVIQHRPLNCRLDNRPAVLDIFNRTTGSALMKHRSLLLKLAVGSDRLRRLGNRRPHSGQLCLSDLHRLDGGAGPDDFRWLASSWPMPKPLGRLLSGVAISAVAGIGLGLWIGLSARFDWLFSPIFVVMQAAPLAALIPDSRDGLRHRADIQGLRRLHHGDAGDRAEHRRRGPQHARLDEGNGDSPSWRRTATCC